MIERQSNSLNPLALERLCFLASWFSRKKRVVVLRKGRRERKGNQAQPVPEVNIKRPETVGETPMYMRAYARVQGLRLFTFPARGHTQTNWELASWGGKIWPKLICGLIFGHIVASLARWNDRCLCIEKRSQFFSQYHSIIWTDKHTQAKTRNHRKCMRDSSAVSCGAPTEL